MIPPSLEAKQKALKAGQKGLSKGCPSTAQVLINRLRAEHPGAAVVGPNCPGCGMDCCEYVVPSDWSWDPARVAMLMGKLLTGPRA